MTKLSTDNSPNPKEDSVYQNIVELLKNSGADWEEFTHEPVYTSEQAATLLNHPEDQGTKTLALVDKKKKNLLVVTVAGNERVDLKAISDISGLKRLSFCDEEVVTNRLGVLRGALAPFGYQQQDVPIFLSKSLLNMENVYINPGQNDRTIRIKGADFGHIAKLAGIELF